MLDAALGTLVVVEDADRTVLDAHVLQLDVALRVSLLSECSGNEIEAINRGVAGCRRRETALALAVTAGQLHGENGTDHHHALGIDPFAQQLAQTDIKLETLDGEIGSAILVGRIVDRSVG